MHLAEKSLKRSENHTKNGAKNHPMPNNGKNYFLERIPRNHFSNITLLAYIVLTKKLNYGVYLAYHNYSLLISCISLLIAASIAEPNE